MSASVLCRCGAVDALRGSVTSQPSGVRRVAPKYGTHRSSVTFALTGDMTGMYPPWLAPPTADPNAPALRLRRAFLAAAISLAAIAPLADDKEAVMQLKPCPFCAWITPMLIHSAHCFAKSPGQNDGFKLRCDKCGIQTCWWHTKDQAIAAWNSRAEAA